MAQCLCLKKILRLNLIKNKPYWNKSCGNSGEGQDNRIENVKMIGETCVKLVKSEEREMQRITKKSEPYVLWLIFLPSKAFEMEEEVYHKVLMIYAFVIETKKRS